MWTLSSSPTVSSPCGLSSTTSPRRYTNDFTPQDEPGPGRGKITVLGVDQVYLPVRRGDAKDRGGAQERADRRGEPNRRLSATNKTGPSLPADSQCPPALLGSKPWGNDRRQQTTSLLFRCAHSESSAWGWTAECAWLRLSLARRANKVWSLVLCLLRRRPFPRGSWEVGCRASIRLVLRNNSGIPGLGAPSRAAPRSNAPPRATSPRPLSVGLLWLKLNASGARWALCGGAPGNQRSYGAHRAVFDSGDASIFCRH